MSIVSRGSGFPSGFGGFLLVILLPISYVVETTIYIFRALSKDGYRTYGHFADMASFATLDRMINNANHPIPASFIESIKKNYLTNLNLKKLDIGGGMIHGDAIDFKSDSSNKIVLAHTSIELNDSKKSIGSEADFGATDVLINSQKDFIQFQAEDLLKLYFPQVSPNQIQMILNNKIGVFNPKSILIKNGEIIKNVFLVLSGIVESIQSDSDHSQIMSEGNILGEIACLNGVESFETYRAVSYVRVLVIPKNLFLPFVIKNDLYAQIERIRDKIEFLQNTWLVGDKVSYLTQRNIASKMEFLQCGENQILKEDKFPNFYFIISGKVQCIKGEDIIEELGPGDYFGEENSLFESTSLYSFVTNTTVSLYSIPGEIFKEIPIIRWKIIEKADKRMKKAIQISTTRKSPFYWKSDYSINISNMDNHHKRLFDLAENIYYSIIKNNPKDQFWNEN